jgi:hypothetical protein
MSPGRKEKAVKSHARKIPSESNKKNTQNQISNPASSIRNHFISQQPTQNLHDESFSSTSSFDSASNGTMVDVTAELPQMISVLEARRKSLEERTLEILKIKDEQIKKVLLNVITDIKNVVEDSDKILQCQNEMIKKQNDDYEEIKSNSKSINNLTKGVGNLADGLNVIKTRVESLEVTKNCSFDSQFINFVFVDADEADGIENGISGPKQKLTEILSGMKIVPPKEIVDAHLMTVRRFANGRRKQVKMLRIRFNDSITAGRIFSQVIKHNKQLSDAGNSNAIRYYAEMPASKNVWNLKRICYEMKNEGTLINVRGSDRGILVTYKIKDRQDESKDVVRTSAVTSENDIDDLRKLLNVDDAYMSVTEKYNADFWNEKRKPESRQKRGRENDGNDSDISNNSKRTVLSSNRP